jgi:hypothetical protein
MPFITLKDAHGGHTYQKSFYSESKILEIKKWFIKLKGVKQESLLLLYAGRRLDDNNSLERYQIMDSTLYVVSKVTVTVHYLSNTFELSGPVGSIESFSRRFEEKTGIPSDNLRILTRSGEIKTREQWQVELSHYKDFAVYVTKKIDTKAQFKASVMNDSCADVLFIFTK